MTLTPTSTITPTFTFTSTLTSTPTFTPTPLPTVFLSGESLLYLASDAQTVGLSDDLRSSLALVAAEGQSPLLIPLRLGQVNGFRVELLSGNLSDISLRLGIAYRLQDTSNYLLFSVIPQARTWQITEVRDGVYTEIEAGTVTEGIAIDRLAVSGLDQYFRFEIGNSYIQRQQEVWATGSAGLWFETNQSDFGFIQGVQLGLLGEEAIQAAAVAPTLVPAPLDYATFLLTDIQQMQAAGSTNAVINCDQYQPVYETLERHLTRPQIASLASETIEVGALIYNRCLVDARDGQLDMNDNLADYLDWEANFENVVKRLRLMMDK